MKKKMRSLLALALALCLFAAFGSNCLAAESADKRLPLTASARNFFEARGIAVSNQAVLKIVEIEDGLDGAESRHILCLSQTNGNICTNSYFAFYEKSEDEKEIFRFLDPADESYTGTMGQYTDKFDIMIHFSIRWEFYPHYDGVNVRPIDLSWSYEEKDEEVNVSHISVTYATSGTLLTNPDLTVINNDYTWRIVKQVFYPSENTSYSSYNPLSSSRLIDMGGLIGGMGGMGVFFDFTVDGKDWEDNVPIFGGVG